jgi:hypothetical protein
MYLPSDLTLSKAIQNELLGTVKVPSRAHALAGSRPTPFRATFPSHTRGMSREKEA